MTTLSGQLIFVFVVFLIYLLPRVYKNFLLTCIVYLVLIVVDGDQYFKKCAFSDSFCKIVNISFIIVFGIHLIFGLLLIAGDIKKKHKLMIPWLLWWFVPTIGIIFIASIHDYLYLALAGWIIAMCLDIYFFKYRKCKASAEMPKVAKDKPGRKSINDSSELQLANTISANFQQSDLWC